LKLAGECNWRQWIPAGEALLPYEEWEPSTARSYGSVNATVRQEIVRMAREEGILADPIYTAKLCMEVRKRKLEGTTLVILGGGTLSLMGFEAQLRGMLGGRVGGRLDG